MKRLDNYVNEVLVHGNFGKNLHNYKYFPKTRKELQDIIIQKIKDEGLECDLNDIDVSDVDTMAHLFLAGDVRGGNILFKGFNGDISRWDVSNIDSMGFMFSGCEQFNCDISEWDVSNVKDMDCMFDGCKSFDQDLTNWNVSKVIGHYGMFDGCIIKENHKPKFK